MIFAQEIGPGSFVAAVPDSSFYDDPSMCERQVRFKFCKKESTLAACAETSLKEHSRVLVIGGTNARAYSRHRRLCRYERLPSRGWLPPQSNQSRTQQSQSAVHLVIG